MGIRITQKGDFIKTLRFLKKIHSQKFYEELDKYGQVGIEALRAATPKRTGKTSESWEYEIVRTNMSAAIIWKNTNENQGRNIAVLIQYGHGTRNGGYVRGIDFINPAMKPIFEEIANGIWRGVISDE